MLLFLDTNIVLDLLLEKQREPHYVDAAQLISLSDKQKVRITTSALTIATANYLLTKVVGYEKAKEVLLKFTLICDVEAIDREIIRKALTSTFKDTEDGMQYYCAVKVSADIIITRDKKDFKNSTLSTMSAKEFLAHYKL
jgi:predicted nucleic acid-binding protein